MSGAAFWDRIAERYAARPIGDEASYAHTLGRTAQWLPVGARVLELGCGTGTTALRLTQAAEDAGTPLAMVEGTDLSTAMIAIARRRAAEAGVASDRLRFSVAAADRAGHAGAPWDAVLGFNLLHLLDDPAAAVSHAAAVLRPGGVFVTKTVCLRQRGYGIKGWAIAALLPVLSVTGKVPRMRVLTSDDLTRMLTDAGFEIVETDRHGGFPHMQFLVGRKP